MSCNAFSMLCYTFNRNVPIAHCYVCKNASRNLSGMEQANKVTGFHGVMEILKVARNATGVLLPRVPTQSLEKYGKSFVILQPGKVLKNYF